MKTIKNYRDLEVWKKGISLVKDIYLVTKSFPKDEQYGLSSQMRRCAVSIPSNISEGKIRQHTKEYIQFLYISLGSCAELDTQIIISNELGYISDDANVRLSEEVDHIARMLRNLIKSLRK